MFMFHCQLFSANCQLIRTVNKQKCLEWVQANLYDNFDDFMWSDESSIQLDCHKRYCCRKEGEQPRPKPRQLKYMNGQASAKEEPQVYVSLKAK